MAENLYLDFTFEADTKTFLHPYQTAKILCEGEEIGYLGKVAYEVASDLDLRTSAYVMEIDLKLLSKWYDRKPVFEPLSKFPEENRDLALVMNKEVTCGQVEDIIYKSCAYVKNVELFDVYEGSQIPEDKKSMAFAINFVPKEQALENEDVDRYVNKILKNLKKELEIEIRS